MKYGDAVRVEFIDLADPRSREEYSEVAKLAEERDLMYPLVAVNGHLRVAGSAHGTAPWPPRRRHSSRPGRRHDGVHSEYSFAS